MSNAHPASRAPWYTWGFLDSLFGWARAARLTLALAHAQAEARFWQAECDERVRGLVKLRGVFGDLLKQCPSCQEWQRIAEAKGRDLADREDARAEWQASAEDFRERWRKALDVSDALAESLKLADAAALCAVGPSCYPDSCEKWQAWQADKRARLAGTSPHGLPRQAGSLRQGDEQAPRGPGDVAPGGDD